MRTWEGEGSFLENAREEEEITKLLSAAEIESICSLEPHLRHIDSAFRQLGLN